MTHDLKTWPVYFAAILDGSKTFEARKDDRNYAVGDTLRLREWDPPALAHGWTGEYTGREVIKRVTYILRGPAFGVEAGWCVLALGEPTP
ncbi:MAG TPA: ASCH/PUA domain-containing protein [Gemmatimonadales bacterium]|nr:ASCH/PUA domain-containing protein [Gemmatimonadales bacterium]